MKRVLLLRHAKSSWDAPVARDYDRPLNARGRQAGKRMGAYLRTEDLACDILLASPALRIRETVTRLQKGYGGSGDAKDALDAPEFRDKIYMASTQQMLQMLRGLDDSYHSAMVLAHNPGIQGLALTLTPGGSDQTPKRARLDAKFPTCALAIIDIAVQRWRDLSPASGKLERFVKPRDLSPT